MRWSRRQVLQGAGAVGLGLLAGCALAPSRPQEAPKRLRLGRVTLDSPSGPQPQWFAAFLQGMRELGYIEGQNLVTERRSADGQPERLPALIAELVALPVDVILASSASIAVAAKHATGTIPIVTTGGDPVGAGLAASLARPGGNVTGLTSMAPQLGGKRLELLKEAVQGATQVAIVWEPTNPTARLNLRQTEEAAAVLGVPIHPIEVRDSSEFEAAVAAAGQNAEAVLVLGGPLLSRNAAHITDSLRRNRLPSMFQEGEFTQAGGLMSYGPNAVDQHRRAAGFVDKVFRGANPTDLPIEQPMRFDFIINLRTAEALGLTMPHHVLLQATEVIQ
jgi:putative tryptophan/tyrosine transport system substrate-binding protein